ncbi:ABC transporter permease [Microaerobacter geothermalis]|uniref:ABC transporter permease n=1 Tax=Microaerobacter geothermalis TaxID=674972 RepID=UPI001F15C76F|nr:ABC transporter permease [Microaerobacter geothermalis]MCF6095168.1 ABC transporter permease [Microaerobacter geothermalis]
MNLLTIVYKNIFVKKYKTLFFLLTITLSISVIVVLFLLTLGMKANFEDQANKMGVKFSISPPTEKLTLSYQGINVGTEVVREAALMSPDVLTALDKLRDPLQMIALSPKRVDISRYQDHEILMVALNMKEEARLKEWWEIEGAMPEKQHELLLGSRFAAQYGLNLGDSMEMNGEIFVVTGLLKETGTQDDQVIFYPMESGQGIHYIDLYVKTEQPDQLIGQLKGIIGPITKNVEIKQIKDGNTARYSIVSDLIKYTFFITLVIVLLGSLIIFIFSMSLIHERVKEIGVFRAIGYRKKHIVSMILSELSLLCGLSAILGFVLAYGSARIIEKSDLLEGLMVEAIPIIPILSYTILTSIAISLLASLYPAIRAANLDPIIAFREV